ncbi:MAG: glycosyltransferase family 2 protein [Parcubacteria group bacterium]|nr:glycosyltransferase family 2 protein [Parcubacteria group bacterium]
MISVIFPAYNEEKNIEELHLRIRQSLEGLSEDFEIIAVDDGSTDETLAALKKLYPLTIISLAKNKGQSAALDAGIKKAGGDVIVTIDADLQNNPEDIPLLIQKLREGYDVVSGWRANRHDGFTRKMISRMANNLTSAITGLPLHDSAAPLKAIRKEVLAGLHLYGEMHSFLPAILYARGARVAEVPVSHAYRKSGVSKYHLTKLMKSFADLLVIKFMSDYLARPFLFFGGWGLVSIFLGIVSAASSVVLKLLGLFHLSQTPLPTLAALFVVVGVLLIMMGFLAEIILRIYYENKGSTPYIIKIVIENK